MNSSNNGSLATALSDGDVPEGDGAVNGGAVNDTLANGGVVSDDTEPYNVMGEPDSDRHVNAAGPQNALGLSNVIELSSTTSEAIIPPAA